MHIIIVGCGKVGSKFANVMSQEGHDVAIVDNDANSFKGLDPSFRGITMTGAPIDQDILRSVGIENADAFAALTPDDNINIMASQIAQEIFRVPHVIARIYNPERESIFHDFGLKTICPTKITVETIKELIMQETEPKSAIFGNDNVLFKRYKIENKHSGKKLKNISVEEDEHIFGVLKNNIFSFADPEIVLERDDCLVVAKKID